jgi:hypothetical protein
MSAPRLIASALGRQCSSGRREAAAASLAWRLRRVDCGHDVMIDKPDELTAILEGSTGSLPTATSSFRGPRKVEAAR